MKKINSIVMIRFYMISCNDFMFHSFLSAVPVCLRNVLVLNSSCHLPQACNSNRDPKNRIVIALSDEC